MQGYRWVSGQWFYHEEDSYLRVNPPKPPRGRQADPYIASQANPRRLFWCAQKDNADWPHLYSVNAIDRSVSLRLLTKLPYQLCCLLSCTAFYVPGE